jgi:hypothetical protein
VLNRQKPEYSPFYIAAAKPRHSRARGFAFKTYRCVRFAECWFRATQSHRKHTSGSSPNCHCVSFRPPTPAPVPYFAHPTRLSTAQISGSALSSPAPAFSGLSVSLLRACARGHARCAGSWIESGLTASIGIRKEAAGCYVAPLPASNRPTIAGITPSKSSLGMKSYKVRFTWQQGEACATSPISRTNCVDRSRCPAIRVR